MRGVATLATDAFPRAAAVGEGRGAVACRVERPRPRGVAPPPAADQRGRQPVAMQHEVGAEPSLHAQRPLVRRHLLDPRTRHAHDVVAAHLQVHLASHAAVGADRAHHALLVRHRVEAELRVRQHVVDRSRGADAHALAAPGAAGVLRIAVGPHDDVGIGAAPRHVEHAHHLDILASTHAARAEDAGAHVVQDHRVGEAVVAFSHRHGGLVRGGHVVLAHQRLEFIARAFGGDALHRIALEQHREHAAAVRDGRVRLRRHHHSLGRRRRARRQQLGRSFDRDQANAAVAGGRQLRIPAERRDVDGRTARRVEDRLSLGDMHGLAVDRQRRHSVILWGNSTR